MKNLIPIYFLLCVFCILSCSKDDPTIIHKLKEKNLASITQTYEVDMDLNTDGGITIVTDAGCKFNLDPKNFYSVLPELKGKINIDIIEIFDRGTMAITGKHTMSYDSILISGGEFFLSAYQGDNMIYSDDFISVEVPVELTGDFYEDMQLFSGGSEGQNTLRDWRLIRGLPEILGVFGQDDTTSYSLVFSGFNWYNCDRFYDDPRERIYLDISYPSQFKNKSVAVYLAIKGEKNSLGLANQGLFPIGLDVHLIFTVEVDDQFLYQIITDKISDKTYKFDQDKMGLVNPAQLKDIINNLD